MTDVVRKMIDRSEFERFADVRRTIPTEGDRLFDVRMGERMHVARRPSRSAYFCAGLVWLSSALISQGQDYERVAPKAPEPARKEAPAPAAPTTVPADETLVVKKLLGMVFIPSNAAVQSTALSVSGVQIEGLELLNTPEFRISIESYLDKPLTMRDVRKRLVPSIVQYCHARGIEAVHVSIPEQDVSGGTIQVVVASGQPSALKEVITAETDQDGGEVELLKKLVGIVFVSNTAEFQPDGVSISGIQTKGVEVLDKPEFRARVEPCLGRKLTMRDLKERIIGEVSRYCHRLGRMGVYPVLPEQDLTSGTIQVVVLEGRMGVVRATGNRWFSNKLLESEVKLHPGDPLESEQLLRDINRLNSNPFRSVDVVFAPGKKEAKVNIELHTTDRFPVRFFTGYEDSGNDATGDERLLTGFNWGSAFGLDHQMNYQFMGDARFNKTVVHSASYVIPMMWANRFTFFGFHQSTKPDTDLTPGLDVRSHAWQSSVRYNHSLPKIGDYAHEAVLGFDFKQTVSNLRVGNGLLGFDQSSDVVQWVMAYNSGYRDSWGRTGFGGNLFYSPGDVSKYNTDTAFRAQRAFAGADYRYLRFTLERATILPWDFSWMARGIWQVSPDGNLLPSEQLAFGGYQSVRGYDERLVGGDEGHILTNELWTPGVSVGSWCGISNPRDRLQFLGFIDYGVAENCVLLPGEDPSVILLGAGPGLRYSIAPYLSVRADYGFQLKDVVNSGFPSRHNSRWHLGVVMSY